MKKIIIAPDSFKETMTNIEVTDIISFIFSSGRVKEVPDEAKIAQMFLKTLRGKKL